MTTGRITLELWRRTNGLWSCEIRSRHSVWVTDIAHGEDASRDGAVHAAVRILRESRRNRRAHPPRAVAL